MKNLKENAFLVLALIISAFFLCLLGPKKGPEAQNLIFPFCLFLVSFLACLLALIQDLIKK